MRLMGEGGINGVGGVNELPHAHSIPAFRCAIPPAEWFTAVTCVGKKK